MRKKYSKNVPVSEFKLTNKKYGEFWNQKTSPFLYEIFGRNASLHANFIRWTYGKKFNTVLEIGCGCGVYADILKEKLYSAIDIHEENINYLDKMYPDALYHVGNFMEYDFKIDTFELVFAHNVMEHMNDPSMFLEKMIRLSTKYIYIGVYTGIHNDIKEHKIIFKDGYYENNISTYQVERILDHNKLKYTLHSYKYLGEHSPGLVIKAEKIHV